MNKLTWSEKVKMISINPEAATLDDVARLASELMEAKRELVQTLINFDRERIELLGRNHE